MIIFESVKVTLEANTYLINMMKKTKTSFVNIRKNYGNL